MSHLAVQSQDIGGMTPTVEHSADERTTMEMVPQDSPMPPSANPDLSDTELSEIMRGYKTCMAYLSRTGRKDQLEEEEEVQLFDGSTHSFLVSFGETKDVPRLIIAVFVILVQMVLYIVTANDALSGIQGDEFTVPVSVQFGRNCNIADNLVCAPEMPNLGYTVLAACILAFFLMHDLIAGVRLIVMVPGCSAKITGLLVLAEAILAAFIGTIFALSASEGYDAIANCIGVLFIHDVDEKAFEAVMALKVDKAMSKCWKKLTLPLPAVFISTFFMMVFSMSLAAILRDSQFANLEKIYGKAYTDKYFSSDGTFNYDAVFDDDYDAAQYWDGFVENGYWGTTAAPTRSPTVSPTAPTENPTMKPTSDPTNMPSDSPSSSPSNTPTHSPTVPTEMPSKSPSPAPTRKPTSNPTPQPTSKPTSDPTSDPTSVPTLDPTITYSPTNDPTSRPTPEPTQKPTTSDPTPTPTSEPSTSPTKRPTAEPTPGPTTPTPTSPTTSSPTATPTTPTKNPTFPPTLIPESFANGCRVGVEEDIHWIRGTGVEDNSLYNCVTNQCKDPNGQLCCKHWGYWDSNGGWWQYQACPGISPPTQQPTASPTTPQPTQPSEAPSPRPTPEPTQPTKEPTPSPTLIPGTTANGCIIGKDETIDWIMGTGIEANSARNCYVNQCYWFHAGEKQYCCTKDGLVIGDILYPRDECPSYDGQVYPSVPANGCRLGAAAVSWNSDLTGLTTNSIYNCVTNQCKVNDVQCCKISNSWQFTNDCPSF